jgi:biotin carboxyl carrier protein
MRRYALDINGKSFSITVVEFAAGKAVLEVGDARYTVRVEDVATGGPKSSPVQPTRSLARAAEAPGAGGEAPGSAPAGGTGAPGAVTAPIPGQVLKLLVAEGEEVTAGKPVLVMEAMKMENVINAHTDGTVGSILVNSGDAVTQGQELLVIV